MCLDRIRPHTGITVLQDLRGLAQRPIFPNWQHSDAAVHVVGYNCKLAARIDCGRGTVRPQPNPPRPVALACRLQTQSSRRSQSRPVGLCSVSLPKRHIGKAGSDAAQDKTDSRSRRLNPAPAECPSQTRTRRSKSPWILHLCSPNVDAAFSVVRRQANRRSILTH
jgi:hypothetical protein